MPEAGSPRTTRFLCRTLRSPGMLNLDLSFLANIDIYWSSLDNRICFITFNVETYISWASTCTLALGFTNFRDSPAKHVHLSKPSVLMPGTSFSQISAWLLPSFPSSLFKSHISALPKKKGRDQVREPREKNNLKLD